MHHFFAQQIWLLMPLCGIKDIWPRSIYLLVTVGANDGYLFVKESTTFTFDIAVFKESVNCLKLLAALVAMQYLKLLPGTLTPFKLVSAFGASQFIAVSHKRVLVHLLNASTIILYCSFKLSGDIF